jgi:LysR family glycine cleavage system transcriptional activator
MLLRLPPFSGLTAFYAAARHGTLTGAAQELNVSQPAISRRIAALEVDLGCALFDRSHKPARLTDEGQQLLRVLRSGFGQIEQVVSVLRSGNQKRTVTVAGRSGFIAFWLIPRLADLEDAFPDVTIRIMNYEENTDDRTADIVVRFGVPNDLQARELKILGEEVFPVASPLYMSKRALVPPVQDFSGLTMLTMESARQHWHDWPSWFEAVGETLPLAPRFVDFNAYSMVVNATLAGQGVCLCWSGLLDNFLEAGALVRLSTKSARSQRGYLLSARDGLAAKKDALAVLDWIKRQAHVEA